MCLSNTKDVWRNRGATLFHLKKKTTKKPTLVQLSTQVISAIPRQSQLDLWPETPAVIFPKCCPQAQESRGFLFFVFLKKWLLFCKQDGVMRWTTVIQSIRNAYKVNFQGLPWETLNVYQDRKCIKLFFIRIATMLRSKIKYTPYHILILADIHLERDTYR